jgi:hypothetical protein
MEYHLAETVSKDLNSIEHQCSNLGKRISSTVYFLLCESCFWSASIFGSKTKLITHCPLCNTQTIESMLISGDDVYRFEYNLKQGVVLEFKH